MHNANILTTLESVCCSIFTSLYTYMVYDIFLMSALDTNNTFSGARSIRQHKLYLGRFIKMLIVSTPVPLILHVSLADVYVDARPLEVTCSFIG